MVVRWGERKVGLKRSMQNAYPPVYKAVMQVVGSVDEAGAQLQARPGASDQRHAGLRRQR